MDLYEVLEEDNQVTDATTAKTWAAPVGARGFYITATTADIWIRFGARVPAANVGLRIPAGQAPRFFPIAAGFQSFGAGASCPTTVMWVR